MSHTLVLALLLTGALLHADSQSGWGALQSLIGDWEGEGSGEPGSGQGGFSMRPDLDGRVLVRRNRATASGSLHEDLMIVYREDGLRAVYFDNEGHVIRYRVSQPSPARCVS